MVPQLPSLVVLRLVYPGMLILLIFVETSSLESESWKRKRKDERQYPTYISDLSGRLCAQSPVSLMNSRKRYVSVSPPPSLRRPPVEEDGWNPLRSGADVVSPSKKTRIVPHGRHQRKDTRQSRAGPALLTQSAPATSSGASVAVASVAAPVQMPRPAEVPAVLVEEGISPLNTDQVTEDPWLEQSGEWDMGIVEDVDYTRERTTANSFEQYVDAVLTLMVGFIHLSDNLFAVQGWSKEKGEGQV